MVRPSGSPMAFETTCKTDVGCVRSLNEDSVLVRPDWGLWLVADGMGGHAAGDFASQTIVGAMETVGLPTGAVDLKSRFMDRLTQANRDIQAHAEQLGSGVIGSTVAALLIQQDHFACIWSGDSRVYRMRGSTLTRVTRDHTEVQALLDTGAITLEEAEASPRKNVITRAIGVTAEPDCDMVEGALADADTFLLCSDGLTEYFADSELAEVLYTGANGDLGPMCEQLVKTALERGGKDNVSVVMVRCRHMGLPEIAIEGEYPELRGQQ
ncbi:serine/threonine protein phosphatase [Tateyamaria sp. ANG-S1]|nr:serine/threonine protein phosphatase [Tateyamaria sp. ANG-S1]